MKIVLLVFAIMIVFYLIAIRFRGSQRAKAGVDKAILASVAFMVFIMGLRMGSNQEVIDNLGTIGVVSVVISVILWVVTILAVMGARNIIGLDRHLNPKNQRLGESAHHQEEEESADDNTMTILILACTLIGLLIGYFLVLRNVTGPAYEKFDTITSNLMMVSLGLLIATIGFSMGLEGTILDSLKKIGLKVMIFPFVILAATAVGSVAVALIFPQITVGESLAVGFGYGWYTLAPGIISAAGHEVAAAISFLHNVIREIGGIVLIPFVAKKIGYLEAVSVPGICCMDVGLPILMRTTRDEIIAFCIAVGLVEEIATTVLVPLCVGA